LEVHCNAVGSGTPIVENYAYDAHGNTLSLSHLPHLDWDFKDQLCSANLGGGGTAYYTYDAGGNRTRKVIERNGGSIEERIYLDGVAIYRKRQGGTLTFERQTLHVNDDIRCVALVETRTQGSEAGVPAQLVRFQLSNHLGSASLELDGSAQVISYEEYYPFGSTSYQAVRSQTETPKRYRFIAMERDEETGFGYHTARYYLPWLGRWLSADPAGFGVELNVYAYCNNNPVNLCDRNGKDWTIAEINKFIDTNGDHRISVSELQNLGYKVASQWQKRANRKTHRGEVKARVDTCSPRCMPRRAASSCSMAVRRKRFHILWQLASVVSTTGRCAYCSRRPHGACPWSLRSSIRHR
jgi:RHS repeat-associated protein